MPDWTTVPDAYARVEGPKSIETAEFLQPRRRLRFRLLANPTVKRDGKRHGIFREQDQRDWLSRKADRCGFIVLADTLRVTPKGRIVSGKRSARQPPLVHHAVQFDGILEVADRERLAESIASGIGSAKAFGFGLLSLAPYGRSEE